MKVKILNFVNIVYKSIKQEVWPYRYYILLFFLMMTSFTIEMLTYTRIVRFIVICVMLILYKKVHEFIEKKEHININIKYITWLMKINTFQNPVLYLIWKWDIYMYNKLEKWIHKKIKNKWVNGLLIVILWNVTVPLKIIYYRFYETLNYLKKLTLKTFFFDRIYGFLLSILVFSDIIKYIYNVTGGILNLMIYICVLLYSLNLLYVYYYYVENQFQQKNIIKKIMELLKKTIIYKIFVNYIFVKDVVFLYETRIEVSILGTVIKKVLIKSFIKRTDENVNQFQENERLKDNILILRKYLYEIPDNWRYWLYKARLSLKTPIFFFSYFDSNIQLKSILELNHELDWKKKYFNIYFSV